MTTPEVVHARILGCQFGGVLHVGNEKVRQLRDAGALGSTLRAVSPGGRRRDAIGTVIALNNVSITVSASGLPDEPGTPIAWCKDDVLQFYTGEI